MSVYVAGSLNLDTLCRVSRLPRPGETVMGRDLVRSLGGKGANQAVAAARYGAPTILAGAVGADSAAEYLLAALREAGVDLDDIVSLANHPTGQAYITVAETGENTIVVIGGANAALTPDHLRTESLERASVLLAQFETPFDVIEAVFSSAAARRGVTVLNAAPALADGAALFGLADILVVNQTELARYAETDEPDSLESATIAARRLISRPDQTVVVTLGAGGAVAIGPDIAWSVAGRVVEAIDTTGAGDCFCGVLAAAIDQGQPLHEAMVLANAAAALSTQRRGAGLSAPTRAETEAFVAFGGP